MYASRTTQFIVGIFGIVGIIALSVLAFELGNIPLVAPQTYTLYAMFDNVSGLNDNDAVQIAGVKVGKVEAITLSQKSFRARVALLINNGVTIDSDAIASIKTSGLIGSKYIAISIGGGDNLKDGGQIMHTESSFVIEDLIGQLIGGTGKGGGAGDNNQNPSASPTPGSSGNPISPPPGLKNSNPSKDQNKPNEKKK
ncbi:MAG TPA: outer membrane lipid asymmetry maintenance protein MlaD [Candidatus Binataceae bacterium]|nr:outer membrane lipid asymmetry maintenance protein MlaD [Candidatus Binataceae bacterium]